MIDYKDIEQLQSSKTATIAYIKLLESELVELLARLEGKQSNWTPKPGELAWDEEYELVTLIDKSLRRDAWLIRVSSMTRWVHESRLSEPLYAKLLKRMHNRF